MKTTSRPFLILWGLAVMGATLAFVVYLAMRVESIRLGYALGREQAELDRMREMKRVLELELASHQSPERVDLVSRTLLGMEEPSADRVLAAGMMPVVAPEPSPGDEAAGGAP